MQCNQNYIWRWLLLGYWLFKKWYRFRLCYKSWYWLVKWWICKWKILLEIIIHFNFIMFNNIKPYLTLFRKADFLWLSRFLFCCIEWQLQLLINICCHAKSSRARRYWIIDECEVPNCLQFTYNPEKPCFLVTWLNFLT